MKYSVPIRATAFLLNRIEVEADSPDHAAQRVRTIIDGEVGVPLEVLNIETIIDEMNENISSLVSLGWSFDLNNVDGPDVDLNPEQEILSQDQIDQMHRNLEASLKQSGKKLAAARKAKAAATKESDP